MIDNGYHIPVLLHAAVDGLVLNPNGIYVDVTFGGGGHSREILSRLGEAGNLIGFDQLCPMLFLRPVSFFEPHISFGSRQTFLTSYF